MGIVHGPGAMMLGFGADVSGGLNAGLTLSVVTHYLLYLMFALALSVWSFTISRLQYLRRRELGQRCQTRLHWRQRAAVVWYRPAVLRCDRSCRWELSMGGGSHPLDLRGWWRCPHIPTRGEEHVAVFCCSQPPTRVVVHSHPYQSQSTPRPLGEVGWCWQLVEHPTSSCGTCRGWAS